MIQEVELKQIIEMLTVLSHRKTAKIDQFTFYRVALDVDEPEDVDARRFHGYEIEYPIIEVYYQDKLITRYNTMHKERWQTAWYLYERLIGVVDAFNAMKFRIDGKQVN